jgi:ABC-type spermidine/putrescine transport system permease subunit I
MILPMYTSLEKIDPAYYEAAADLGANSLRTFLKVTLPCRCRAWWPERC